MVESGNQSETPAPEVTETPYQMRDAEEVALWRRYRQALARQRYSDRLGTVCAMLHPKP